MTADLEEKRGWIRRFFSETGRSYDAVVNRFTFGIDRRWKARIVAKLSNPSRVLDLACGTGILTFAIKRRYPRCEVVGVDITAGYLAVARKKAEAFGVRGVTFIHSAAEDYCPETRFEAVTTSYLPKYADIPRLIGNAAGILNPGGIVVLHDFTYPTSPALRALFSLYFRCAQPIGGWCYPEWKGVLIELPEVIRRTTWVKEVTAALAAEGFEEIAVESLTLQGAALVTARKPR